MNGRPRREEEEVGGGRLERFRGYFLFQFLCCRGGK